MLVIDQIGDAAHPMTPNLGQGANQAIEDAVVLAACLKAENEVSAALYVYEARRLKRANALVRQSARFGQVAHLQQPSARSSHRLRSLPRPQLASWYGPRPDHSSKAGASSLRHSL